MLRECKSLICPCYECLEGNWPNSQPVCATNGFTYGNVHIVRCLKDYQPSLEILHEGGCSLFESRRALGEIYTKQKACAIKRRDFEQNPICLSNNITYTNPFQALCEMPRLREKIGGKCHCPFQKSCEKSIKLLRSLRKASDLERVRQIVCGSDQRTYRSQDHLECARRFNPYLHMLYRGSCRKLSNPCPNKLKTVNTPTPVCGSDNESYISYEALVCAQIRMKPSLKFIHSGACVRQI